MNTQKQQHATSSGVQASSLRQPLLAIALIAGALVASSTTAGAQQPTTDPGVRCAAKVGAGEYEFYLPGERATDINGNKWVCGPDGQWFRDYSSITVRPPLGTRLPTTVLVPVLAAAVARE